MSSAGDPVVAEAPAAVANRPARAVAIAVTVLGVVLMAVALAPTALWYLTARSVSGPPTAAAPVAPPVANPPPGPAGIDPPRTILIPAIGVRTDLVPLGIRPDGALAVPDDYDRAGWYADGPEPGEPGAAVIVGHVDSKDGPAAFFRLHELQPGQPITIRTTSGSTQMFLVERVEQHTKERFPTAAVYGTTPTPVLRLVTCGGQFDRARASYRDNVIVYARPAT